MSDKEQISVNLEKETLQEINQVLEHLNQQGLDMSRSKFINLGMEKFLNGLDEKPDIGEVFSTKI